MNIRLKGSSKTKALKNLNKINSSLFCSQVRQCDEMVSDTPNWGKSFNSTDNLRRGTPFDVELLESIEAGEDASAGDAAEDVGPSTLHQRHESLRLHDLDTAVDGALVFDSSSGGHHHPSPDGVDGVGHEAGSDRNTVAEAERQEEAGVGAEKNGLQRVVQSKVHASVYEDADARDDESSVEADNTVRLEGFGVDVDQAFVLTFSTLALGVIREPRSSEIERVDEQQRQRPGTSARQDVGPELDGVAGVLGHVEHRLHLVLEGEIKRLRREVPQAVGQIATPERLNALRSDDTTRAVDDTIVGSVQTALLDHFILVLDEQLDAFNRCSRSLGDNGSHAGQGEILHKP